MNLTARETELVTLVNQAKTLYADLEAKGDKVTGEERTKLYALIEDGEKKRAELDQLKKLAGLDDYASAPEDRKTPERDTPRIPESAKSWGQRTIESEEFKHNDGKNLKPVQVGGIKALKALYGSATTTGGNLTVNDRQTEIFDIARQRPKSVIDLLNQSQTASDAVEYILMDSRTNNAAVVPEYTGGNFGLKPESDMTFDLKTASVKTIPTWIPVSRQILQDAPRLRAMIDGELQYMVEIKLEDEVIAGDGTGNHFTGILNWTGIQSRVHATSGRAFVATDNNADTLRRAITDIWLEFYRPDGIVVHPTQGESLELLKDDNKNYLHVYDSATMRIWRLPVVETPAMTSGTALVAQFALAATIWDRMQTEILTGQPNDYFLRNAYAILAELRAAFAVTRPKAVEKVTGLV